MGRVVLFSAYTRRAYFVDTNTLHWRWWSVSLQQARGYGSLFKRAFSAANAQQADRVGCLRAQETPRLNPEPHLLKLLCIVFWN